MNPETALRASAKKESEDQMFKSSIDTLVKKHSDAVASLVAAKAALESAYAAKASVDADVATRSHGGVISAEDQLTTVLAECGRIEAEDAVRCAESVLSVAAGKLGVARKDPAHMARDPELLLGDLSKLRKSINEQEATLGSLRGQQNERVAAARASFESAEQEAQKGGARPAPLPLAHDELGRSVSESEFLERLQEIVAEASVFERLKEIVVGAPVSQQLLVLRHREKELRATIERQRLEAEKREAARREYVEIERRRHEQNVEIT